MEWNRRGCPSGRQDWLPTEQYCQPVSQGDAGARCLHDFQLGWGCFPSRNGFNRCRSPQWVAAHYLVHAFGHQGIADRIHGIHQRIELLNQRRMVLCTGLRQPIPAKAQIAGFVKSEQRQAIHDLDRRD